MFTTEPADEMLKMGQIVSLHKKNPRIMSISNGGQLSSRKYHAQKNTSQEGPERHEKEVKDS